MFDQTPQRGITMCVITPALVTGTTSTITSTVTANWCCNGKEQTQQTALTNAVTPVVDYNTGLAFPNLQGVASGGGQGAVAVYGYLEGGTNGVGSVKIMQGPRVALDASGNFSYTPQFPAIPDNITPFAYQVLKCYGASTSFVLGVSAWAATGCTNVIVNVKQLPVKPQSS